MDIRRDNLLVIWILFATVLLSNATRNQKTVEQSFIVSRVSFQGWNHQPINQPSLDVEPDPKFDSRTSQVISRNVLQLAQDIGRALSANNQKKSEVFSPLSIYGAMSLLLMGASGQTHDELIRLLRFNEDPYLATNPWKIHEEFGLMIEDIDKDFPNARHKRPSYYWQINRQAISPDPAVRRRPEVEEPQKISIANGLFVQNGYSIRPDYQDAVLGVYHSTLKNLDFARNQGEATKYINDWVNEKTNGKIRSIVEDRLSPDTKVIMASALYFKATWERKFIAGATQPRDFYPNGLEQPPITVDMMAHGGTFPHYNAPEYGCQILGLPYQKNLTTMYIIVPNNSNRQRLQQFQAELTADKIEDMISKMQWKTVILLFPKLHIENQLDLGSVLHQMGVSTLFDRSRSDLSLISTGQEILNAWLPSIPNGNSIGNAFNPVNSINQYHSPPRYPGAETEQSDSPFLFSSRFGDEEENKNNKITTTTQDSTTVFNTVTPKSKQENVTVSTTIKPETTTPSTTRKTKSTTTVAPFTVTVSGKSNITTTAESITTTEADEDVKTTIITTTQEIPAKRAKRSIVKYKAPSEFHPSQEPLRFKDFVLGKRIVKSYPRKKPVSRGRREISPWLNDPSFSLKNLDVLRTRAVANRLVNPGLFVDKVIHKIDLTINERGTEGGAATVTVLRRSGTDVVLRVETPFMFLIRHDDTRLPLFYGTVYEPTNF